LRKVAVSQRVDVFIERGETRDGLDQRLTDFLIIAGFLPVPVPNLLGQSKEKHQSDLMKRWLNNVGIEAVFLSGGNDIGQCDERDLTEECLLSYASCNSLPVLGICRGMQMMAAWAGVKCHPVDGHVRTHHKLTGKIAKEVNSYHGFSLTECPDGFEILARSQDGEIEAIRHLILPWEGWMWHPERESIYPESDLERAIGVLNA